MVKRRLLAAVVTGVISAAGGLAPAWAAPVQAGNDSAGRASEAQGRSGRASEAQGAVVGTAAVPPGTRAMWLWWTADPTTTVAWASSQGVTEIFAYVPAGKLAQRDLRQLRTLKLLADRAGIRLAALGGDPTWVLSPSAALAWQRQALATGLFHGSHVDVEPYLLPAWETSQPTLVASYLRLLEALQAADSRPLEVDVPFWYNEIPSATGNLADAVLERVDAVTVMSYRDTAVGEGSILGVGVDMLRRGATAGRPVRLAVETGQLADCPYCTFYEEGQATLAAALAQVDLAASDYASFTGLAVHHYASWRTLKP